MWEVVVSDMVIIIMLICLSVGIWMDIKHCFVDMMKIISVGI